MMSNPGCAPAVVFNYGNWVARYPEFTAVGAQSAGMYFDESTLYCANRLNPVPNLTALTMLLYMLTAHIAVLNSPVTPAGGNPLTPPGRLSNATEGSVSAQFEYDTGLAPGSQAWYVQTKYGAAYWAASLPYRLFRYKAPCYGPASLAQIPWVYPNTGS